MKTFNTVLLIILCWATHAAFAATDEATFTEIKNLKQLPNHVFTGGQPDKNELRSLAQNGVKTIVNFRAEGEFKDFDEAAFVEELGMHYVHIPIDSKAALSKENIARFRAALTEHQDGVFLHCGSGNRVGALFALDAFYHDDMTAEEALQVGEKAGLTSLKSHVKSLLEAQ